MDQPYTDDPILLLGELFRRLLKAALGDFITSKTREYNLNQTHIKALLVLNHTGGMSMSQLGMKIGLEKGSVTSVIDSLLERNLVTRSRSSEDKRMVIVKLTVQGAHIATECHTAMQQHVHQKLKVLDVSDQHAFFRSLADLDGIIKKIEQLEENRDIVCGSIR